MSHTQIDISQYSHSFSTKNKIARVLWYICYWLLFRPLDTRLFKSWRSLLLKIFGAKIGTHAHIYASARIWAPWNLELGTYSTLGPEVDCYNQGKICIGAHTTISQKAYLCASSHDISSSTIPLILEPIVIKDQAWIAADAFIGPGVTIGKGAVVGARSAVFKDVEPWSVVGGNPAQYIKTRKISQ
jgi:putative colanic acid biosynthesis acetyltransferase WcaF